MPGPWEKYASGPWTKFQVTSGSAKAAYETGQPGANFEPDNAPDMLGNAALAIGNNAPLMGAMLGGATSGMVAGLPTMGMGAPGAAIVGAGIGAGAGQLLKQGIQQLVAPDQAPKSALEGIAELGKQMVGGAELELGGQAIGAVTKAIAKPVLEAASNGLNSVADWLSAKSIPLADKFVKRVGGPEGVKEMGALLNDYGVTSVPGTLRKLGARIEDLRSAIGGALSHEYGAIDDAAVKPFTKEEWIAQAVENYKYNAEQTGKSVADSELKQVANSLEDYFSSAKEISFSKAHSVARTMEGKLYQQSDLARRSVDAKAALALRQSSEEFARQVAPPQILESLQQLSSNYNKVRTAADAVQARLNHIPNIFERAMRLGKAGVGAELGYKVGGTVGAVVGGTVGSVTSSTLAKTLATSLADQGAEVLGKSAHMAPRFAKTLAQVAASKGLSHVVPRHAYLMLNNSAYRKSFIQAQGLSDSGNQK